MENAIKKSVYQIVGSDICVEAEDGQKVYEVLYDFLSKKQVVILSFLNVTMITSAFFNTAIGLLYKDISEEDIKKFLKLEDLQPADAVLLKRVVETAKLYFKEPERLEKSIQEILEEE